MPTTASNVDRIFLRLSPDPLDSRGRISRADAYEALLAILANARTVSGGTRTTANELWTVIGFMEGSHKFGDRELLRELLRVAEKDGEIRLTSAGYVLLRADAPTDGGIEHVWIRYSTYGNAEVEVIGAAPWPVYQRDAPGPAWWHCAGCREHSGMHAETLAIVREAAKKHANQCNAEAVRATD